MGRRLFMVTLTQRKLLQSTAIFLFIFSLLFFFKCSKVLLINKEDIKERKDAVELSFFQNLLMRHIESAKETFLKK